MTLRNTLLMLTLLAMTATAGVAQNDVYDNGPSDGQDWAWLMNFGFVTSDTFNYTQSNNCYGPCEINGLSFVAWLFPGDVLYYGEVSITSSEYGGTTYFDQNVNFTQSGCFTNNMGFQICTETAGFPGIILGTGTYWLNLQNFQVNTGDPIYWDQNSGPSLASNNSSGQFRRSRSP